MLYTGEQTWRGGYFELSLEVTEQHSDEKLFAALQAIWSYPLIEGVYLDRSIEPSDQPRLPVSREYIAGYGMMLYGIAHMGSFTLACGTSCVREDDGSDWLNFFLPFGAIAPLFPVGGFPFGTSEPELLEASLTTIDDWLIQFGRAVFHLTPFALGLVGFETSGQAYARDVRMNGVPAKRFTSYLWPHDGLLEIAKRNLTA